MLEITEAAPGRQELTATHSASRHHREAVVDRFPVRAAKDPRVAVEPFPFEALPEEGRASARRILPLIRVLLPHSWAEDEIYLATAARICMLPGAAEMLDEGCAELERQLGGSFATAAQAALHKLLRANEKTPFFRMLLGSSVRFFYDDPRVWAGCGYEGVHGCRGLEQRDGIADAKWLPDPKDGVSP